MKRILLFIVLVLFISRSNAQIAAIDVDKGSEKTSVEDIIIVFKMHFDIGYTDWSESILQKYATSMMDETLHSVDVTSKLPQETTVCVDTSRMAYEIYTGQCIGRPEAGY